MDREEWVRDFLQWQGAGGAPGGAAQRWHGARRRAAVAAARKLVETVIEHEAPIALVDLLASAEDANATWLRSALAFGCKEALLLVCLDADSRPFVGVWRAPAASVSAGPVRAPQFDGRPLFCRPLLIDDMATLLLEATAAPPRIKADQFTLFARARDSIGGALTALPDWIRDNEGPFTRGVRVDVAASPCTPVGVGVRRRRARQGPQSGGDRARPALADGRRRGPTQAGCGRGVR